MALLVAAGDVLSCAAAGAQPPQRVPRIGILFSGTYPDPGVEDLRQALRELGYVEGRVRVEYRFAEGRLL